MSDEIKFLKKYAETLGLKDKSRLVFCARFDKNNFGIGNNVLAEKLCSDVDNPTEALQYHLRKVLDKLPQVGISHKNVGRGRPKSKEEPWKEVYEWLWDKPYSDYLEKYGTKPPITLDQLCRESSRRSYRHLTISKNPLMAEIGLTADRNNVVSLEIVERKQISKKREDIQSSEQGSSFYQPTENEQGEKFSTTDSFLDEVIRDLKTKKSQGMRIAITGEAGAGKTTLLQSIGIYLEALNKNLVPIWISLKQVTKSIDAYLVDEYLREITGTLPNLPIPSECSESLNNLLKSGQVVLLLDGADESTELNILGNLGEQLNKPIFNMVQVVLTCRINTWDTQWQSSFDVYRIIPFTYPVQVESFIDHFSWEDGENLAVDLKKVLRDESKSRLVDMVTNPLRLALLCYLWKNGQQSLPDTKAELYRLMLEAFYRQKELEFGMPSKDLENALSELALSAFNKKEYRYLLSEGDVSKLLGSLNDKGSLFWQAAKQFGLLNQVGKSSINSNENTYAFYHASFQEYFAALAVSDLDNNYFFPIEHFNNSTPVKGKDYHIFSSHWKEVILFWIGRSDIESKIKEQFIHLLMCFYDDCGGFYKFRALCLATECLSEFKQIEHLSLLINLITSYAFIFGSDDFHNLYNFNYAEASRLILNNLKINELSENLENKISKINVLKLQFRSDKSIADLDELEIAKILISISPSNQTAFNVLIKLIENNRHNHTFITCDAIRTISKSKYINNSLEITQILLEILNNDQYLYALKEIFQSLGDICCQANSDLIKNCIIEFIKGNEKLDVYKFVNNLKLISQAKEYFTAFDIDDIILSFANKILTSNLYDDKIALEVFEIIEKINNISIVVNDLEILLPLAHKNMSLRIARKLLSFDIRNKKAIEYFLSYYSLPYDRDHLKHLAQNNSDIYDHLNKCLQEPLDWSVKFDIADTLFRINPNEENQVAQIMLNMLKLTLHNEEWIVLETAKIFIDFNLFLLDAIQALRNLINDSIDGKVVWIAITYLWKLSEDNILDIDKLISEFVCVKSKFNSTIVISDLTNINLGRYRKVVVCHIENIIKSSSKIYFEHKLYIHSDYKDSVNIDKDTNMLPYIAERLLEIDGCNLIAIQFLINILTCICIDSISQKNEVSKKHKYYCYSESNFVRYIDSIIQYAEKDLLPLILSQFKVLMESEISVKLKSKNHFLYSQFHKLIWHCSQNMSYPDFYKAWHSQTTSNHPEIVDTIPSNNTNKIQTLESQLIDCDAIQKELDRNTDHPEIRCLVIDIRHLEQESDPNVIAKKLTNKIFNSIGRRIPVVQDVSCLERELLNLKFEPSFENLAIALYGKSANEAINQLCQSLTPIQIRPFTGGQTTQELITQINAWLSEM